MIRGGRWKLEIRGSLKCLIRNLGGVMSHSFFVYFPPSRGLERFEQASVSARVYPKTFYLLFASLLSYKAG